jgi:hypothetical protein
MQVARFHAPKMDFVLKQMEFAFVIQDFICQIAAVNLKFFN